MDLHSQGDTERPSLVIAVSAPRVTLEAELPNSGLMGMKLRSRVETNRRAIIKSASLVGGVAVVGTSVGLTSACTSEEPGDSQSDSGADATVEASEVPVGSGTVVDETYVITQPKEGEFHAFSSVCTHQGCQVRTVTEKEIVCPCHSSRFSTTSGEVTGGPATEPLAEYSVSETGGKLTISGSS